MRHYIQTVMGRLCKKKKKKKMAWYDKQEMWILQHLKIITWLCLICHKHSGITNNGPGRYCYNEDVTKVVWKFSPISCFLNILMAFSFSLHRRGRGPSAWVQHGRRHSRDTVWKGMASISHTHSDSVLTVNRITATVTLSDINSKCHST